MFTRKYSVLLATLLLAASGLASASTLQDISFSELPGERAEIRLAFDSPISAPQGYSIDQPARIVLDFSDVENGLPQKKYPMNVGDVTGAVVVAGGGKTRLIINLAAAAPYVSRLSGSELVIEIGSEASVSSVPQSSGQTASNVATSDFAAPVKTNKAVMSGPAITGVDFRRGDAGEGRVIINLSDANVTIDIEEVSSGIDIRFMGADVPSELRRKLDVMDFATPVKMLTTAVDSGGALVSINAEGEYDYLAYQTNNEYVVSIKPLTRAELEEKKKQFAYTGERLSVNFQDIQVRSVLQLIADFTDLNLVASDTVSGSITLRLDNVPWDQALDLVLKTKGLDKRQIGNVLMVAPAAEIAEREKQEIETQKQLQELAPMRTEYIRIRYANARELFNLFVGSAGKGGAGAGGASSGGAGGNARNSTGSILSDRGQAIVDERTNSIILTDTEEKINDFKQLVDRIDIPVKQVMIEARIVIANSDFRKELGVRMAGDAVKTNSSGSHVHEFTGSMEGLYANEDGGVTGTFYDTNGDGELGSHVFPANSLVDLGVFGANGNIAWNIISGNFLLGLELSALQDTGFAEIVSQPKVITGDKQQATIESGSEVPYQEESASGGTTTAFKDVVLRLDVTPQITPDNRIIMELKIDQDSVSGVAANGVPILDITHLETSVLVADGDTIVLGGIYQTETIKGESKVPLLGDIPFVGRLFRKDIQSEDKRELLIFVTPRIMKSDFLE
ncbi:type IV pilus secretin PilQ [Teredinibacter waterburyi]|jgi:type IV pilus secretin (or competence protein) PilQ|uniref:Type IV pilus secretin (Or competence protein) PilQ n=1 Tax=Teredinibacter waterburyi TaxID=1500538 RepID=A0A0D3MF57_9GAMM|nr:type IV pilus secretin PilQ [Teredinibacter waterburyi]AIH07641.1 type IV pilus secretin (or competence protein) PilQ [Teredinibacter waterburyi]